MSQKKLINSVVIFIVIAFSACSSIKYKDVPYFQDLKRDKVVSEKISNLNQFTIQVGDLLAIHVVSLNHEADAIYNYSLTLITPNVPAGVDKEDQSEVVGYIVDDQGNIHYPMIGPIKVAGLTTEDAASLIESKLTEFLSKPSVNIRIQNFKVSIIGDVGRPGTYGSKNERLTIPEALAFAGDLNITGIRNNLLLIREIGGQREFVTLDLTSKSVFDSPYFYLKNNDIIYVQPSKEKVAAAGTGYQKASLIISALSLIAILITRL